MKEIIPTTKALWHRYKGKIAVVSLAITAGTIALALRAGKDINNLLNEEGLADKYYSTDEE